MFAATTQIRVRYAETDQMGYVYYGNYAMYYEVGRVEALRQAGFEYKKMEEDGIMMPVLENYSKFHQAGKYDELLSIKVMLKEKPSVKITFYYEITNESGILINEGKTTLVFANKFTGKPCRPPQYLIDLLDPYFSDGAH